ncbi:hypothetical protein BLNAU_10834 [Blattamonas nauphoetae]|uniref:Uncharacterized protein n=1 Tax=Blattamonas nauphoetae TaxID=2049346 RepID=A0ABQ9XRZ5_9EUKA|nr:hypothetical protein BLNAU_10834 [Blattamonas nauphoetae]
MTLSLFDLVQALSFETDDLAEPPWRMVQCSARTSLGKLDILAVYLMTNDLIVYATSSGYSSITQIFPFVQGITSFTPQNDFGHKIVKLPFSQIWPASEYHSSPHNPGSLDPFIPYVYPFSYPPGTKPLENLIISMCFSPDATYLLAITTSGCLYIFPMTFFFDSQVLQSMIRGDAPTSTPFLSGTVFSGAPQPPNILASTRITYRDAPFAQDIPTTLTFLQKPGLVNLRVSSSLWWVSSEGIDYAFLGTSDGDVFIVDLVNQTSNRLQLYSPVVDSFISRNSDGATVLMLVTQRKGLISYILEDSLGVPRLTQQQKPTKIEHIPMSHIVFPLSAAFSSDFGTYAPNTGIFFLYPRAESNFNLYHLPDSGKNITQIAFVGQFMVCAQLNPLTNGHTILVVSSILSNEEHDHSIAPESIDNFDNPHRSVIARFDLEKGERVLKFSGYPSPLSSPSAPVSHAPLQPSLREIPQGTPGKTKLSQSEHFTLTHTQSVPIPERLLSHTPSKHNVPSMSPRFHTDVPRISMSPSPEVFRRVPRSEPESNSDLLLQMLSSGTGFDDDSTIGDDESRQNINQAASPTMSGSLLSWGSHESDHSTLSHHLSVNHLVHITPIYSPFSDDWNAAAQKMLRDNVPLLQRFFIITTRAVYSLAQANHPVEACHNLVMPRGDTWKNEPIPPNQLSSLYRTSIACSLHFPFLCSLLSISLLKAGARDQALSLCFLELRHRFKDASHAPSGEAITAPFEAARPVPIHFLISQCIRSDNFEAALALISSHAFLNSISTDGMKAADHTIEGEFLFNFRTMDLDALRVLSLSVKLATLQHLSKPTTKTLPQLAQLFKAFVNLSTFRSQKNPTEQTEIRQMISETVTLLSDTDLFQPLILTPSSIKIIQQLVPLLSSDDFGKSMSSSIMTYSAASLDLLFDFSPTSPSFDSLPSHARLHLLSQCNIYTLIRGDLKPVFSLLSLLPKLAERHRTQIIPKLNDMLACLLSALQTVVFVSENQLSVFLPQGKNHVASQLFIDIELFSLLLCLSFYLTASLLAAQLLTSAESAKQYEMALVSFLLTNFPFTCPTALEATTKPTLGEMVNSLRRFFPAKSKMGKHEKKFNLSHCPGFLLHLRSSQLSPICYFVEPSFISNTLTSLGLWTVHSLFMLFSKDHFASLTSLIRATDKLLINTQRDRVIVSQDLAKDIASILFSAYFSPLLEQRMLFQTLLIFYNQSGLDIHPLEHILTAHLPCFILPILTLLVNPGQTPNTFSASFLTAVISSTVTLETKGISTVTAPNGERPQEPAEITTLTALFSACIGLTPEGQPLFDVRNPTIVERHYAQIDAAKHTFSIFTESYQNAITNGEDSVERVSRSEEINQLLHISVSPADITRSANLMQRHSLEEDSAEPQQWNAITKQLREAILPSDASLLKICAHTDFSFASNHRDQKTQPGDETESIVFHCLHSYPHREALLQHLESVLHPIQPSAPLFVELVFSLYRDFRSTHTSPCPTCLLKSVLR